MYKLLEIVPEILYVSKIREKVFYIKRNKDGMILCMTDVDSPANVLWQQDLPKGTFFSFHDFEDQMIGIVPKQSLFSLSKVNGNLIRSQKFSFHAITRSLLPMIWGYMFSKEKSGHSGIVGVTLNNFKEVVHLTTNKEVISLILDDRLLAIASKDGAQLFQSYDLKNRVLNWEKPIQAFSSALTEQDQSTRIKTVQGVGNSSICYLCSNEYGALGISWENGKILWKNNNLHSLVQRFNDRIIKLDSDTFEEYSIQSGDLLKSYSIREPLLSIGMQRFSNNWFTVTPEYVFAVEQLGKGIFAVNRKTGSIDWSKSLDQKSGKLPYAPILAGRLLYVLNSEGYLYCFEKEPIE